jgi:hypothetical protein
MTFIAVTLGCLLGSFLGNSLVFFVIGSMAKQAEEKQRRELQKLQQSYLEMAEKERKRMENYAKLES